MEENTSRVMSKGEKKARKALEKIGLEEVHDVVEFSIRRMGSKFIIMQPAVYKLPGSEHYVVYGEPRNDFMDTKTRLLLQQLQGMQETSPATTTAEEPKKEDSPAQETAVEDDGYVPEEGDVEMLMKQANTTHDKAYAALKKTHGDLVNAFFEFQ